MHQHAFACEGIAQRRKQMPRRGGNSAQMSRNQRLLLWARGTEQNDSSLFE